MTKREFYEAVVAVEDGAVLTVSAEMKEVAFAGLKALDKASDYKHKSAEKDKAETLERAEKVYDALVSIGTPSTCTAIANHLGEGFSVARVSALCRKLGDRVVKTYSPKGVALYSVAE